jgi:hypothetical protein
MNCTGFNAGFMFETSPAGTPGVERRRWLRVPRWDVVQDTVQVAVVVPVDPFHRRVFDVVESLADLESGEWRRRYGELLHQPELDLGYRLLTADLRQLARWPSCAAAGEAPHLVGADVDRQVAREHLSAPSIDHRVEDCPSARSSETSSRRRTCGMALKMSRSSLGTSVIGSN